MSRRRLCGAVYESDIEKLREIKKDEAKSKSHSTMHKIMSKKKKEQKSNGSKAVKDARETLILGRIRRSGSVYCMQEFTNSLL